MVKFETKLNADSTKQLNKQAFKRLWWVMLVLSLLFVALGLIGYFFGEDDADKTFAISLMVIGVLFAPLVWLISGILQKNINKSAKFITDETDEIYIFDDDKLYIKQVSAKMQSESTYAYDYLFRVVENATHYFLYISKMQCHIVPKDAVTEGTLNELNELLRVKLGQKFYFKKN